MKKLIFLLLLCCIGCLKLLVAQTNQDTMRISVDSAEKIFLQRNLGLLAAKYNIDANKALIQQARLWDNPVLNTDQNIYDGKFFQHNENAGQVYLQLMQLIRTSGKLKKAAQLATDNAKISEQQFNELIRNLRYALHSDLEEVQHLLKIRIVYSAEISEVQKLVNGMDAEFAAGNIPLKDNIRVKALLFSLQNELINVQNQLIPLQAEISVLLQESSHRFIQPIFAFRLPELIKAPLPILDSLEAMALQNRYDLKAAETALAFQQHNLVYQKALSKADINVGVEYDRFSSYIPNLVGLAVSVPLNFFNRNQGNIKSAELSIQSQKAISEQAKSKVISDIYAAYSKFAFYQHINDAAQLDFSNKYDSLFLNMLKSYQDRQLSLLEFIDFMDAYKDTKLKLIEQHNGLIKSLEDLNYAVGKDVFKLN